MMSLNWSRMLAGLGVVSGLAGFVWYESLSPADKDQANKLAESYAWQFYQKKLADLADYQACAVHEMTRAHFN